MCKSDDRILIFGWILLNNSILLKAAIVTAYESPLLNFEPCNLSHIFYRKATPPTCLSFPVLLSRSFVVLSGVMRSVICHFLSLSATHTHQNKAGVSSAVISMCRAACFESCALTWAYEDKCPALCEIYQHTCYIDLHQDKTWWEKCFGEIIKDGYVCQGRKNVTEYDFLAQPMAFQ